MRVRDLAAPHALRRLLRALLAWRIAAMVFYALATLSMAMAQAQTAPALGLDPALEITTIPLWDRGAPGALGTTPDDVPTLTEFPPHKGNANGTAVIIAPGGSYLRLASNLEGRQVADWFASRGVTAFVLRYRLGARYLYPIPLQDAQRAMRLVRARAAEFGIDPARIGFVGFSAGGHLAAETGTMFDSPSPQDDDPISRVSSRPDFLVLGYPWLNAMEPKSQDFISYCSVLKIAASQCQTFTQPYTPVLHVTAKTPPTFLYHTSDDKTVPVEASVSFYRALQATGVPAEMHIFATGTHGSGLGRSDPALDVWPALLEAWMRGRGLLNPPPLNPPPK